MDKLSFFVNNINTDLLTAINGVSNTPATVKDWIHANPLGQYWSELDENGFPVFCMYGSLFTNNTASFTDSNGNNPYTVECSYFKDHPVHAPH